MKVKINFYELRKINLLKSLTMIVLSTGLLMSTSCEELDELLGLEDDEEVTDYSGSSGGSTNAAYSYTYTCAASGSNTVTIPAGTTKCQKAQEYFAKTYSCNDVDNFNTANCKVCADCTGAEWQNYCALCD